MKPPSCLLRGAFFILGLNCGFAQENQPALWYFKSDPIANHEVILSLTAQVAPGWHLYSQFMEEGGPMPTRFLFGRSGDYALTGITEEKGNPLKFHDDTYEMDITWYTGEVSFTQKIRLSQPTTIVSGSVEYMVCSDYLCVPCKQNFSIHVSR